jgi:taurine dioxygenase
MRISQVSDHVGALIEDVDITQLTDSETNMLVDAWGEHGALFFRGQTLDEQQHIEFAERFSSIDINKFFTPIEGHPQIAQVLKEADHTTRPAANRWRHTFPQRRRRLRRAL